MSLILLLESSVIFKAELPLNHGSSSAGCNTLSLFLGISQYNVHILNSPLCPLRLREIQVGPC